MNEIGFKILGEQLLIHTLSCACYFLSNSPTYNSKTFREGSTSLNYVNNSGIETMINYFQLNLDSNKIKTLFFMKVNEKT